MSARSITLTGDGRRWELGVSGPDRTGEFAVSLVPAAGGGPDGGPLRLRRLGEDAVGVAAGQALERLTILRSGRGVWIGWRGRAWYLEAARATRAGSPAAAARDDVRAPMTGTLLEVRARPGQRVRRDDVLAVLEAMKMEYRLTCPRDGEVAEVSGATGGRVELGDVIVRLRPEPGE